MIPRPLTSTQLFLTSHPLTLSTLSPIALVPRFDHVDVDPADAEITIVETIQMPEPSDEVEQVIVMFRHCPAPEETNVHFTTQ